MKNKFCPLRTASGRRDPYSKTY